MPSSNRVQPPCSSQNGRVKMRMERPNTGNPLWDSCARIFIHSDVDSNGCWITEYKLKRDGYSRVKIKGKAALAHRVTYQVLVGPIPDGLTLDHLCRNRGCCNPYHLEPISLVENIMRGDGFGARNARKTHCNKGHEFTDENTRTYKNGRWCRTCVRERSTERRKQSK